ncbi:MAG: TraE/TraK family type IV conjugative transfer system protein [Desulfurococcaceae archaeon]
MLKRYISEKEQLLYVNKFFRRIIFILALVIAVQSLMLYYVIGYTKVVLIPPQITSVLEITGKDANEEYIKGMTKYLLNLALSYTPQSIEDQLGDFLKYVEPSKYESFRSAFLRLIDDVKTTQISSSFYVDYIKVDRQARRVIVRGSLLRITPGNIVMRDENRYFAYEYLIKDGKFMVTKFIDCGSREEGCVQR